MYDLIKTFLARGLQIILILLFIWFLYFVLVFFFSGLPEKISETLNLKNNNASSTDMTLGERIYNMFPDFKFPEPKEIKENVQSENKPWILDDNGKPINELNTVNATTVIPETKNY